MAFSGEDVVEAKVMGIGTGAAVAALLLLTAALLLGSAFRRRRLYVVRAANIQRMLERIESIQEELMRERVGIDAVPAASNLRGNWMLRALRRSESFGATFAHRPSDATHPSVDSDDPDGSRSTTSSYRPADSAPRACREPLRLEDNVWRWCVDSDGVARTTYECPASAIRVLICIGGRLQRAEHGEVPVPSHCNRLGSGAHRLSFERCGPGRQSFDSAISRSSSPSSIPSVCSYTVGHRIGNIMLSLSRHEMFDPSVMRCCVVADDKRNPMGTSFRPNSPVVERAGRGGDQLYAADVLPILCDAAHYCIVVVPDDSLLCNPPSPSSAASRSNIMPGFHELLTGPVPAAHALGPMCYLAGLAMLSIKSSSQSFVHFGPELGDAAALQRVLPYGDAPKVPRLVALVGMVDSVKLQKGLLHLWALAVSHGSFAFVRDAAPLLEEMLPPRALGGGLCCCPGRAGQDGSAIDDLLDFFQARRKREPLMPRGSLNLETLSGSRPWIASLFTIGSTKSPRLPERQDLQPRARLLQKVEQSLRHRAIIRRCFGLHLSGEDFFQCLSVADLGSVDGARFAVPRSHPMAHELWVAAGELDWLMAERSRGTLSVVQRFMPLEALATQIQRFLIIYLRKLNVACHSEWGHAVQAAAFGLYAAGVEEQAYLVNLVSEFLCNKAEMRGHQLVRKVMDSQPDPAMDCVDKDVLEGFELSQGFHSESTLSSLSVEHGPTLCIRILGARNLPVGAAMCRNSMSALDDLDAPMLFCTCGVEDSGAALRTADTRLSPHPEWREQLDMTDYVPNSTLVFDVWRSDGLSQDLFVGRARLPAARFQKTDFSGKLPISADGIPLPARASQGGRSTLSVRVSVVRFSFAVPRNSGKSFFSRSTGTMHPVSSLGSEPTWLRLAKEQNWCPSPFTNMLGSIAAVHRSILQVLIEVVMEANKDAELKGISGSATLGRSLSRTSLWELAQDSTMLCLEEGTAGQESMSPSMMNRVDMGAQVDASLESLLQDPLLSDAIPRMLIQGHAQVAVTCHSFWIMELVMQRLEKAPSLVVQSRKSTLRSKRKPPAVTYVVRLKERQKPAFYHNATYSSRTSTVDRSPTACSGSPRADSASAFARASFAEDAESLSEGSLLEVVLTHAKIVAVGHANTDRVLVEMRDVSSICRALRLGDPDLHPSMWCISLGQLQDFAREVETELGSDAYREALCADIVEKVIMKKTEVVRTSYARMVNWQSFRQVDVFVSHCWGENFADFVDSVSHALEHHVEAGEVNLWICCFALHQDPKYSTVKKQIGNDLLDAPFEKALCFAREFLVVRNSECDMYSRAWCVYEIFRARQLGLKITVTGPDAFNNPNVNIMSCTATDRDDEKMIKAALVNAGLVDELNQVVSEIKAMGARLEPVSNGTLLRGKI